ncbi:MAG: WYL domain-containing protein [Verrucomicrobiota bacterium JB023]|nr:WYL domain-containing protein [Verrucomicrobiota bacterium JB023]
MTEGYSRKASVNRAMWVLAQIQSGDYPNCQRMAMDYGVSPKSIQRDIDYLRDQLGAPIEYHSTEFGYTLTGPLPDLPVTQLSEGELVALFLAERAAGALRGTPLGEQLETAVKRISVYAEMSFDVEWGEVSEALSILEKGNVQADAEVFDALTKGVKQRTVVTFAYRKPGAEAEEQRRVRPWHLAHVGGAWYLFAWDEVREAERTFALGRIGGVKLTRQKFQRPEQFSARQFLKGSFGVFGGGGGEKVMRVVLRFNAWAAALVRERVWHESEERKELEGGELELTLKLTHLEEVERWVLSWGPHVEVVKPVALRRRLASVGESLVARYAD